MKAYSDYLKEQLDKSIAYSEYLSGVVGPTGSVGPIGVMGVPGKPPITRETLYEILNTSLRLNGIDIDIDTLTNMSIEEIGGISRQLKLTEILDNK